MDINQKRLKSLVDKTNSTFELCLQHPTSEDYAEAYEEAKNALDQYMAEIRLSIPPK